MNNQRLSTHVLSHLTPDLAAIDVTPPTPVTAIMPSQTLPPSPINELPSSAPPAEIVEIPQHTETRSRLTPDLAAIDVTPLTPVTAIMPSQTLPPSPINELPSSAPPAKIVEIPQHAETRSRLTPDPAAIDVTPSTSVTALDDLPSYAPVPNPCFRWGDKDGKTFAQSINLCYKETVHWRRNLFKVPTGKSGKALVRELARMFQAYADGSALEGIVLQAAMVMPALLLQKPHPKSKAKEHTQHLERRLQLWLEGNIDSLMDEGRTIQLQFTRSHSTKEKSAQQTARTFAKLMMEGKVRAALRLIAEDNGGGPLHLDSLSGSNTTLETVREVLLRKHPLQQPPKPSSIVTPDILVTEPHPIIFDKIDGLLIRSTALRMDGAAGPSGLDAAAWKRLCTSFKTASADLCDSLACTAKRICSCYVDPKGLSSFVACRLIALDKCPGVRPIGIGEMVRRIIGRAIATAISEDIQAAAGPLQVCARHLAGCEAAVHAMRRVYESSETEAVILVDASNAFNLLNRQTALRNVHHLCPSFSNVLVNTYREDIQLFIEGETLLSQEGTTQGDPLAMAMYAIVITPLIHHLEDEEIKQVWFVDDATAGGNLAGLKVGSHHRPWP